MRDRNPAVRSKVCPNCGKVSFRMGFFDRFIRHWLCYCEECGYTTEPSVSDHDGCKPWVDADEDNENEVTNED